MRILRRLTLLILLGTVPGLPRAQELPVAAQDPAIEKEILAIETKKNDAMQKGDATILEQIYGDDLIFVNARGKVLSKQDRVKELGSGSVKYASFRQGDYRVRIYGNTAVVTGAACSVVDHHGSLNSTPRRFTSVYVKVDGHWRFVAHQATLVSDEESSQRPTCN